MQRLHAIEIDICMTQIGVMHRDDVEAQLQAEGADFLKAIAAQIEEALKRAATTDPLTELPNRAAFSAELERWLVRSRRLALGLIDLDGFKQVNDQHGHAAGDDPLKRFGELLKQVADPSDMMARLGGDEFAFLFEDRGAADRLAIRLGLTLRA
jgi:GGDEF domain-containing protein